jgi:hypothetical protein
MMIPLGYTQRNGTQAITKAPAHPCFLQHYSLGYSQDAPLLMNGLRKCGIYTHGILLRHKEE